MSVVGMVRVVPERVVGQIVPDIPVVGVGPPGALLAQILVIFTTPAASPTPKHPRSQAATTFNPKHKHPPPLLQVYCILGGCQLISICLKVRIRGRGKKSSGGVPSQPNG